MYATEIKTLRNELRMLEKSSFTSVKAEMAVIERDLVSLQQKFRDELGRAGNTISIEVNNHKVGRVRSAAGPRASVGLRERTRGCCADPLWGAAEGHAGMRRRKRARS